MHAAVVRPDRAHAVRGLHQGAGRVRLPDHGVDEGDQPLLLRQPSTRSPTRPRSRGRMTRYHEKLAAKVPGDRQDGGRRSGSRTSSPRTSPLKTADWSGTLRRGADRQARRAHRVHARTSGGSTATSTSCCCRASAFCDLYDKVDAARRADRGLPDAAGLPDDLRRRRPWPVGAEPHRAGQPDAEGAVRDQRGLRRCSAALDGSDEGRDFRRQARRVPLRVRLASRRRVRPRRRAVAGGPGDPAVQHPRR